VITPRCDRLQSVGRIGAEGVIGRFNFLNCEMELRFKMADYAFGSNPTYSLHEQYAENPEKFHITRRENEWQSIPQKPNGP
jgi:hypothetical protein